MPTTTIPKAEREQSLVIAGDMVVTLSIGPGNLGRFLDLLEDRSRPRIKYFNGSMTLVSPSHAHERSAGRIDHLIHVIGAVLDIPFHAAGNTLWRRGDDAGIEPDGSYYIAHEAAVRGRSDDIDLANDPPPDLVVEVVITHSPQRSLEICAELGVPEVWLYFPRTAILEFRRRTLDGRFESVPSSVAFNFLTPADVVPWLVESTPAEPDSQWLRRLYAWVGAELAPRHQPRPPGDIIE